MKKILVFAVLASFSFFGNAQEESIRFGAKAGLNLGNVKGDNENTDMRTSFHVGALAEIPISEKFAFQPELLYSSQGNKVDESDFESTTKLDYLQVPLMGKFYVAEGLSLQAGPQVGFLLAANSEGEDNGVDFDEDVKDQLKTIDFGLNLGAGYQLDMGVFFDARYNLGLSNILDDSGDLSVQNSVFQFSVGYKF
ncbi:PorT family protein [Aquimarina sp. D1M17]|uniref:porin family protein n=1 Tax=Aquimarina acroporae TaxID=2937283 RepID=UPI0020BFA078|nr:porin family protein [Aquimarina acroporae]MCK8520263.1 PorT family protein [Aquimarina acroporae]